MKQIMDYYYPGSDHNAFLTVAAALVLLSAYFVFRLAIGSLVPRIVQSNPALKYLYLVTVSVIGVYCIYWIALYAEAI